MYETYSIELFGKSVNILVSDNKKTRPTTYIVVCPCHIYTYVLCVETIYGPPRQMKCNIKSIIGQMNPEYHRLMAYGP